MRIRVLPLSLAIFFLLVFVLCPALQQANALVGIDDALIAVIIAALAGAGITFTVTGGYEGLQSYIESLMQEYAAEESTTVSSQLSGARTGSNRLGQIIVNNRFLLYIDTFVKWIKLKLNLSDNSTSVISTPSTTVNNYVCYELPLYISVETRYGRRSQTVTASDSEVFAISTSSSAQIVFSENEFTMLVHQQDIGSVSDFSYVSTKNPRIENADRNTHYYVVCLPSNSLWLRPPWSGDWQYSYGTPVQYDANGVIAMLEAGGIISNNPGVTSTTGVINPPTDDTDYVPGDGGVIDVDADWGTPFDVIVGQVIPDAVIDGTIGDTVITYDGEDAVQDQVTDVGGTTVSSNPGDYQVSGIASVFPFCIPFDVYNFLAVLDAEPEAPHFQWRFKVPGVYDGTIDIDLSPFNGVAQVLRTAELLLFIVGLAVVTRNRFIRS